MPRTAQQPQGNITDPPAQPAKNAQTERTRWQVDANRELRQRMIAAGLCPSCPRANAGPIRPGRAMCADCLKLKAAEQKTRRERKRKQGICLRCRQPALPGRPWCETHRQARRDYYHRRKAQKPRRICPRCGTAPLTAPHAQHCPACQPAVAQAKRQRDKEYQRRKMRLLADAGLCNRCGQTAPADGRRRCRPCLDKATAYQSGKRAETSR